MAVRSLSNTCRGALERGEKSSLTSVAGLHSRRRSSETNPRFHYTIDTLANDPVAAGSSDRATSSCISHSFGVTNCLASVHTIERTAWCTDVVWHATRKRAGAVASTSRCTSRHRVPFPKMRPGSAPRLSIDVLRRSRD